MGGVNISPNLQKTADRLMPDGRVVNLETPTEEQVEASKEDQIKVLEEQLAALKGNK